MKTRIGYVERLTDKLVGYKGVIFEDHPDRVYIENPPSGYATTEIDGETFAAFPKWADKYQDLHDPRPDINVGDKVTLNGDPDNTVYTVEQVTLGFNVKTQWRVRLNGFPCRFMVADVTKVDEYASTGLPERVYLNDPDTSTNPSTFTAEAPQNFTVTIKAEDLAELELLSRTLSEAITDVLDKERELRNAKETLSKFMEELER